MRQSLYIIEQCVNLIPAGYVKCLDDKMSAPFLDESDSMEAVIHYFKMYSKWGVGFSNFVYSSVESPKGEFGVSLISDNTGLPYRCKIRSPGYYHLQGLEFLAKNVFLADLVAILGSLDIVFGEIDR